MKKQFLALIALGSLVNAQAMFEYGGYVLETLPALEAIKKATNAGVQAIDASGQAVLNNVGQAGSQVLTQIRLEAAKFAAAIPQPVIKESIVEQIQRLGFKQYAKNTTEKFVKSEAFPYLCCAAAAVVLEPVVTGTVRWVHNKWTGNDNTLREEELLRPVTQQNANPEDVFKALLQIQTRLNDAINVTPIAVQESQRVQDLLNINLRLICDKMNATSPGIANNLWTNFTVLIDRINQNNVRLRTNTDRTTAHRTETDVYQAFQQYTMEVNNIIISAIGRTQELIILKNSPQLQEYRTQLFPTPTAPRTSFFTLSEMTKRRVYTMGLFGALCAGYNFATS